MSRPSIFIVGAEGAGTTLLWKCVIAHPDLRTMVHAYVPDADTPTIARGLILRLSVPTLRPPRWVRPEELPPGSRVIVIRRAPTHTVYSAYRRFYTDPAEAWRNYFRAVHLEARYIARQDPLCVLYEDLIRHPTKVLHAVYEFLGVWPDFVPSIETVDQNNGRWRRDRVFSAFMRNAFGLREARQGLMDPNRTGAPLASAESHARHRAHELGVDCCGVQLLIVDETETGVCEHLQRRLPGSVVAPRCPAPAGRYVVRRVATLGTRPMYHILCGDEVRTRAPTLKRVVEWLHREIEQHVAVHSRDWLFTHAGVLGWRGRAILIPGRSMTGKSTLVAELALRGATYYSDEYAILDEEGRVHPYARAPVLRGRAPRAWPPAADELSGGVGREPLPVSLIVSTTYRSGATWQPEVVRGARAVLPIVDNTVLARDEPARLLHLCAKIAPRVVTLQGVRPDAAVVAPSVLQYLDDLLDGRLPLAPVNKAAALARQPAQTAAVAGDVPKKFHSSAD